MLKLGQFRVEDLDRAYVAVVHVATQSSGVLHQVTLRPDKVHQGVFPLIRLGETQGDEYAGWQQPENIVIIAILGHSVREPVEAGKPEMWKCVPIQDEAA